MGNVRRGQLYPLVRRRRARDAGADDRAHGAARLGTTSIAHGCTAAGNDQVRFEVALRTLAPRTRDHRAGARPRVQASGRTRVPAGTQPAGAAVRRRLLDQSRPVGRDDRRQGDADLDGQHSRERLGALAATRSPAARAGSAITGSASSAGRAGASRRRGDDARASSSDSRRSPVRTASAAASTSATRSSAPRAGSLSRRRRPKCC